MIQENWTSKEHETHHELYELLLRGSIEAISSITREAVSRVSEVLRSFTRIGFLPKRVEKDESLMRLDAVGADASSFLLPLNVKRVALISAMAIGDECEVEAKAVIWNGKPLSRLAFKFWYQAQAETLIPEVTMRYVRNRRRPDAIVVDGPLSPNKALLEVPYRVRNREVYIEMRENSTSLTTRESEFDGLPVVICQVHRRTKVSEAVVKELMRRSMLKLMREGFEAESIGLSWGTSLE